MVARVASHIQAMDVPRWSLPRIQSFQNSDLSVWFVATQLWSRWFVWTKVLLMQAGITAVNKPSSAAVFAQRHRATVIAPNCFRSRACLWYAAGVFTIGRGVLVKENHGLGGGRLESLHPSSFWEEHLDSVSWRSTKTAEFASYLSETR